MLMIFLDVGLTFFGHIIINVFNYDTFYFKILNLLTNHKWMNESLINN